MHKLFIIAILAVLLSSCAPPPGAEGGASGEMSFPRFVIETVWFILMCCFVYFMMVTKPREQKETERKKFLSEAKKGEEVLINSSILGKYLSEDEGIVTVEIAPNTKVKVRSESVRPTNSEGNNKSA